MCPLQTDLQYRRSLLGFHIPRNNRRKIGKTRYRDPSHQSRPISLKGLPELKPSYSTESITFRCESAMHLFEGKLGARLGKYKNLCPICGQEGTFSLLCDLPSKLEGMYMHGPSYSRTRCFLGPHIIARLAWFPEWNKERIESLAEHQKESEAEYERQYWQDVDRELKAEMQKSTDHDAFDYSQCPRMTPCFQCCKGDNCKGR
jgi:hypothetical protein